MEVWVSASICVCVSIVTLYSQTSPSDEGPNFRDFKETSLSSSIHSVEFKVAAGCLMLSVFPAVLDCVFDCIFSEPKSLQTASDKSMKNNLRGAYKRNRVGAWVSSLSSLVVGALFLSNSSMARFDPAHAFLFYLFLLRIALTASLLSSIAVTPSSLNNIHEDCANSDTCPVNPTSRAVVTNVETGCITFSPRVLGLIMLVLGLSDLCDLSRELLIPNLVAMSSVFAAIALLVVLGMVIRGATLIGATVLDTNSWSGGDLGATCFLLVLLISQIANSLITSVVNANASPPQLCAVLFILAVCLLASARLPSRVEKFNNLDLKNGAIETKKAFVRFISHEMRTPLNIVSLGLKLCINQSQPTQHTDYNNNNNNNNCSSLSMETSTTVLSEADRFQTLNEISSACDAALDILNELLLFDKVETGLLTLSKQAVGITAMVGSSVDMFAVQFREKRLRVSVHGFQQLQEQMQQQQLPLNSVVVPRGDKSFRVSMDNSDSSNHTSHSNNNNNNNNGIINVIDEEEEDGDATLRSALAVASPNISNSDTISVDRNKMQQVLRNVISNAIKFTPEDGSIDINISFDTDCNSSFTDRNNENQSSHSSSIDLNKMFDTSVTPRSLKTSISRSRGFLKASSLNSHNNNSGNNANSVFRSVVPSKSLRSLQASGLLVIEVKDSGAGISAADQAKLFREIVQFRPEILQSGGGSGLGMWISRSIVELHGGSISVWSAGEGQGTTFTIKLPMTRVISASTSVTTGIATTTTAAAATGAPGIVFPSRPSPSTSINWFRQGSREANKSSDSNSNSNYSSNYSSNSNSVDIGVSGGLSLAEQVSRTLSPSSRGSEMNQQLQQQQQQQQAKQRLLVVDDSRLNRKILCQTLRGHNFDCVEASDGSQACELIQLSLLQQQQQQEVEGAVGGGGVKVFDAVLMDFNMPVMDGPTAAAQMRLLGFSRPIVGVTGNVLASDKRLFVDSGATVVMSKPLAVPALLDLIQEVTTNSYRED